MLRTLENFSSNTEKRLFYVILAQAEIQGLRMIDWIPACQAVAE